MSSALRSARFFAAALALSPAAFSQDDCGSAVAISDGVTPFDTTAATDEGTEPIGCGSAAIVDIWYSYTASADGPLNVSTCNDATYDTRIAVYSGACGALVEEGCNDDGAGCSGFSSDLTITATAGTTYLIRVGGFNSAVGTGNLTVTGPVFPDECADAAAVTPDVPAAFDTTSATATAFDFSCAAGGGDLQSPDVWFTFTATADYTSTITTCGTASYDTKIEVYDGDCMTLNSVGCNDDFTGCAGFTSEVEVPLTNGTQYWVRIGGWQAAEIGAGTLLVTGPPPAVANDNCSAAIALTDGVAEAFDTTMATPSAGVPAFSCGGGTPGLDIWYTVVPLVDGPVVVSLCGSSFDTRLEVYEGNCAALTSIDCNDDSCGLQSEVSFSGTAGTTYYARVAGFNAGAGAGTVTATFLSAIGNDECADAIAVGTGVTAFVTTGATDSGVTMACSPSGGSADAWFSFTAGASCPVTIDLSGSDYDTVLEVFDGADCMALTSLACDDDGGDGLDSLATFDATAGTTYLFHIGGFNGATGNGTMNITENGGIGAPVCVGEVNSSGAGASLKIFGSDVAADNDLTLTVTELPADAMGYFVHSMETNLVMNPGGSQGNLCIASFTMGRFAGDVLDSGAAGTVSFSPDLTMLPIPMGTEPAMAGETRYFQYWTRDSIGGMATSNFSSAAGVTFN